MISRRVNAERLVLLGWSRAILLQLAHPLVAAGVADHSSFRAGAFEAARRLRHTVRAMLALTFGSDQEHARAIQGILAIHRRVHGQLRHDVGPFPAGTRYSAEDPALVVWVHATLIESVVLVYEALIRPLTPHERDLYCADAAPVALELGARPEEVPRTWEAVQAYLRETYASGVIAVGPDARELASAVLSTKLSAAAWPLAWTNRILTVGWLPAAVREQYGFRWTAADAIRFRRAMRLVKATRRILPRPAAWWRAARYSIRRATSAPE